MKKVIIALVILFAGIATANAKSDVTLRNGSLRELKGSNAQMFVRWDYSNSTIEGKEVATYLKERGEDWVRDYNDELAKAESNFKNRLNEKSRDVRAINDENSAEYTIVIKVQDFDYGITALSVVIGMGAGDAHLTGTMEIYKKGQAEPIAVIDIDGVAGAGYGNEIRRVETYRELAEQLAKLIKKAK